jgi:hypothetical protein
MGLLFGLLYFFMDKCERFFTNFLPTLRRSRRVGFFRKLITINHNFFAQVPIFQLILAYIYTAFLF